MSEKFINVLYVDDEPNNLVSFKSNFKDNFNIYFAENAKEAEIILNQHLIHVLVTDQRMPIKLGTELLAESVKKYPEQARILITGYGATVEIKNAKQKGHIFRSLEKPWNNEELKDAINLGYEWYTLKMKIKHLTEKLNDNSNGE